MERASSAIEFKIEIERRLIRAKEILPHGAFIPWASAQFAWDARHVQRHMLWVRPECKPNAILRVFKDLRRGGSASESGRGHL
jgi:hypothetical protein